MKERKAVYNPEADARWREKNREHANYMNSRRNARSFIRTKSTEEDLRELEELIEERRKFLEENS